MLHIMNMPKSTANRTESAEAIIADYNSLCDEADILLNKYDPCKIVGGECSRGRITGTIERDFCCENCSHLSVTGCDTRALACKVWLCLPVRYRADRQFLNSLDRIERKAIEKGFYQYRSSLLDIVTSMTGDGPAKVYQLPAVSLRVRKFRYEISEILLDQRSENSVPRTLGRAL